MPGMKRITIDPATLRRVARHESGHAVMAVVQGIPCKGMFFEYRPGPGGRILGGKFCTIVNHSQPWRHPDYLQAASGAASEELFLGGYDPKGSEDDHASFSKTDAPNWDGTVEEAKVILAGKKQKIELMAQVIISLHENVPIGQWPDQKVGHRAFRTVLGSEVIREIVERDTIPSAVADFFKQIGVNIPDQNGPKPGSAEPQEDSEDEGTGEDRSTRKRRQRRNAQNGARRATR